MGKSAHVEVWGTQKAYTFFTLNFTDQSNVFGVLLDIHCTCALSTEGGNAFESQNGVAVVQTSKVKLGRHCRCDFFFGGGGCLASFYFLLEVYLIYNAMLVSGIQQSDSVIHTYVCIFFRFFSLIGYYKILSIVPCTIQ